MWVAIAENSTPVELVNDLVFRLDIVSKIVRLKILNESVSDLKTLLDQQFLVLPNTTTGCAVERLVLHGSLTDDGVLRSMRT